MKFASSESSLSLSKVTCQRTRVIFHRKLSQANHVRRIMTARLKDSQEGPSFTLPPHQLKYSKLPEPRNECVPSTISNLKFGRHRSQSSNCYSRITRQQDYLESKKCACQAHAATSRKTPENIVFKRNKTRPQDERSKIPILCGKNRDHFKKQTKTTYSNIPMGKNKKNVSIFSNNTTPSPKLKGFENFGKQLNPGNLTSKPVNKTKCYKRMVSLIERLDQVCLLDDLLAGDSKILEYANPNDSFQKDDLKSSINKNECSPVNHRVLASPKFPIKANLSLLKASKEANLTNENNTMKRGSQLSKNMTKLSEIQTTGKDKGTETKGNSNLISAAKKKNVFLKNKNEINNTISFSMTSVDSIDYKTTYSTLSEASTSSSNFDETKNTFDLEEKDPTNEEYQMQFISTEMESTYSSKKFSETTFPTKTKLRQIPIQMPSKLPLATSTMNYTKRIINEEIDHINDLNETQAMASSSKQQIFRQNQTKSYNYQSSRIPIATEKPRTIQKSLKPMKNQKTDSSKSTTDYKCLRNQSTVSSSVDYSCKDSTDEKVSTWLQNLSESEDKKKLDETLEIHAVEDSDSKEVSQRDSMEQTTSSSKIPTLSEHRNGKIAIEFGLDNRSCSSLPHSLEPTTGAHMKNRKSVVDSDMLMGKSNDFSIKNEFFEAPMQRFMDVINSTFSDIEPDESIEYYV